LCQSQEQVYGKNESNGGLLNKNAKMVPPFLKRLLQYVVMCQHKNQDIVCGVNSQGGFPKSDKINTY
jgi:hypothetical protein